MPLDQLTPYAPAAAIAAGVLLLLWGQRQRLTSLLAGLRPAAPAETELSPTERFAMFYALRTWCAESGQAGAVKTLDCQVLPAIVAGKRSPDGGPST
ncbi:MAG: hypothetical protein JXB62_06685 [Pirellulales bacterium]|nr:hypothetical protein [Pirellulales bacterium]